jgi:hypothetical protein
VRYHSACGSTPLIFERWVSSLFEFGFVKSEELEWLECWAVQLPLDR